jgi:hypothetical protein
MRFSLPPRPLLLALALLLARPGVAAESDLELYLDTTTRQLYAEPGPGRVSLGTFRPVASTETAPAGTATASSIPAVAALETRVAQHDERLATLAAAQSKSGWTQNLQIRGYLQNRYTEMLGGDEGVNLWADR